MTPDPAHIWTRLQAELRRRVPDATYEIWLAPLRRRRRSTATASWSLAPARACAPGSPSASRASCEDAARAVLGPDARRSSCATRATPGAGDRARRRLARRGDRRRARRRPRAALFADDDAPLNPKYTFEQFVIGDANRFAHAAALAVAELPGQAYNPLFIYGPPGVGKTHLLHSIGNYVRAYGGGLTVRYTTVERFTNEFLAALKARDVDRFKDRYRRNDVLLIDDVQFLESKVKTEEEFFHTFNALHEAGASSS